MQVQTFLVLFVYGESLATLENDQFSFTSMRKK